MGRERYRIDPVKQIYMKSIVYGWIISSYYKIYLGNLCAIWILRKLLKTSKTPTNVCMMNLSVADWIFCTFIIPITAEALCYRSGTPWKLWIAMGFLAQPVCKVRALVSYKIIHDFLLIVPLSYMIAL